MLPRLGQLACAFAMPSPSTTSGFASGVVAVSTPHAAIASGGELTLAVDGDGVQSGAACTLRDTGELLARDLAGGATATTTAPALAMPITLLAWRSIVNGAASVTCRVTAGTNTRSIVAPLADTTVLGNQALVAAGATASVTSLVLYTSPGPKSP